MANRFLTTAGELLKALHEWYRDDFPLTVVLSQNATFKVKCVAKSAYIWREPDMKWHIGRKFTKGEVHDDLQIRGFPKADGDEIWVPVYWKRNIGWIRMSDFIEMSEKDARYGTVKTEFEGHFVADQPIWPGASPTQRQVAVGDTIELYSEEGNYYNIGPDEWIDKGFVDLL